MKLGSIYLVPDPGVPGLGNQQSLLGVQGGGSHPGDGRSPDFGVKELQVTCEITSKFRHLSEQKGFLKTDVEGIR